ncbi:MAG: hypothetical protein AAGM84_09990 [Pseudomonadota bacterium]
MSRFHDPKNPRHARLFELLRQQNRSETTVARGKGFVVRKVSAEEAAQIKAVATRSLRPA